MSDEPALADLMRAHPTKSLRAFCETYLGEWFHQPWWSSQVTFIRDLEAVVLRGRSVEREMERGKGATSLIMAAAIWTMGCGHWRGNPTRRRIALIGNTSEASQAIASQIACFVERSAALRRDFGLAYISRVGADFFFGTPDASCSLHAGSLHGGRMGMRPALQFADNAVNYDRGPTLVARLEKELSKIFHVDPTLVVRSVETPNS